MALIICEHCGHRIWLGTGDGDTTNHERLVKGPREGCDPQIMWVVGIHCPGCRRVHPAPAPNEEDWFE